MSEGAPAPAEAPGSRRRRLRAGDLAERLALPLAWAALVVVFSILEPDVFPTTDNFFLNIFGSQAVQVVLTLALILPLTAGDYDISVAANLTLSAMIVAILTVNHGYNTWLAALVALAAGALTGFVNGGLIVLLGVDSLIATLGTSSILAGVVLWISDSQTIGPVPEGFTDWVVVDTFLGVPHVFYYALGLCLALWYLLELTPLGRRLLFVGRGRSVARLSGLRVGRLRWGAMVASGVIAAGAGVLYVGSTGSADPTSGLNFLLPAFAGAFLGATTIQPGRFNPMGALVAVYFLVTGITGLQLRGVENFIQQIFYGGALVLGVALSQLLRRREAIELGPAD